LTKVKYRRQAYENPTNNAQAIGGFGQFFSFFFFLLAATTLVGNTNFLPVVLVYLSENNVSI